jgi:hypothetical protein
MLNGNLRDRSVNLTCIFKQIRLWGNLHRVGEVNGTNLAIPAEYSTHSYKL